MQFDFNVRFTKARLEEFANILLQMQSELDFKVSSRGWCYLMEQSGYIDKSGFDKMENAINNCRREGFLPVDFVAEEDARAFQGVEKPELNKYLLDAKSVCRALGHPITLKWIRREYNTEADVLSKKGLAKYFENNSK